MKTFYSRTSNNPDKKWEELYKHLFRVADLASIFARSFSCEDTAYLLGLFHDAGKASYDFQAVLRGEKTGINHEATGAAILRSIYKISIMSDVVFAHHKGILYRVNSQLADMLLGKREYEARKEQRKFSTVGQSDIKVIKDYYSFNGLLEKLKDKKPSLLPHNTPIKEMLLYRMLLSSLVDADYSASAEYENKDYLKRNSGTELCTEELINNLEHHIRKIKEKSKSAKSLNNIRNILYEQCVNGANYTPGLFTITAPTGTGKTLALLAFAAYHAKKYEKKRIIIVLPFLSIISQNAEEYRKIYRNILEVHSYTETNDDTRELSQRWSDGFIITTSVQFFEALFKYKPSDCRKLHNYADSVIIFDEAQSLPAELLLPTLETVKALCEDYNSTVVFSTATQPDFSQITEWKPHEIVKNISGMYLSAKRNNVHWDLDREIPFEEISEKMCGMQSVCCIVNLRDHAYKLFNILSEMCNNKNCFYLSTDMCVEHRENVIKEIKERLNNNNPCRVVSTSCIEAGVDIDFDVMFRALAPLEAIIQAAGRCNRNGCGDGNVYVFIPNEKKKYPQPWYENSASVVKLMIKNCKIDISNPEHIKKYYELLYGGEIPEKEKLKFAIADYDFENIDKEYKLIDNNAVNILVPYKNKIDNFNKLADEAREKGISPKWLKKASSLSVASYKRDKIEQLCEKLYVIKRGKKYSTNWYILGIEDLYLSSCGFHPQDDTYFDNVL